MGASFRNIGEIQALAGCDRLTISPALLEELENNLELLERALSETNTGETMKKEPLSESEFRLRCNEDAMASEKLAQGIRQFVADQRALEALLESLIKNL